MSQLTKSQLQKYIQELAQDTSKVAFTSHAKQQMMDRRISNSMALDCLRRGRIILTPEPNPSYGTIECRMEAFTAGKDVAVVVGVSNAAPDNQPLIVITAILIG